MPHNICAIVIEGPYDVARAASLDLRPTLTHGALTVLPIDHYWSAVQGALRGRSEQLDMPNRRLLPGDAVIADIVRELTGAPEPRFAIIWTEYFGGAGDQAASAFAGERRLTTGTTINEALRALDVVRAGELDEFDTIGLGGFRSNPEYLEAYIERAEALGV